jgi:FtsP/CotA-like multicopper oxidase with cupredoxin domain
MNERIIIIAGLILVFVGCTNNTGDGLTTVKVIEVEQVVNYTYLFVKGKGAEYWVAVPTMQASVGETYQYQGGMVMEDFYSKELDRTFEKVVFLEALFTETGSSDQESIPVEHGSQQVDYEAMVSIEKSVVEVEAGEGTISIADLYADPGAYEGKTILVKGEVTKFNAAIMQRNWVHIQDGTEFGGKFDLTATSMESFEVGSIVTLEGILALNKDFGYGYSYEILLEKATVVQ